MILLGNTTHLLEIVTSTTCTLHVHASYMDLNTSTSAVTGSPQNTPTISTATTTTVVSSPPANTLRTVKFLSIHNAGAGSVGVNVEHTDGTNVLQLQNITLLSGYTLVYNEGSGWQQFDASGNLLQSVVAGGRYLKTTLLTATSGTFTTGPTTTQLRIRQCGGGGQGGGAPAVAGECGSGGASGSYGEIVFNVTPNTGYSYACGAGGSTGGTGAAGQAGGTTTFQVGVAIMSTAGGGGGAAGTSISVPVLGGVPGGIPTGGYFGVAGNHGEPSVCTGTAANNRSGKGADSPFGGGGAAKLEAANATGNTAGGFGAGGGGGATSGTAVAGGAGSGGVIIVDEYS